MKMKLAGIAVFFEDNQKEHSNLGCPLFLCGLAHAFAI